MEKVDDKIKKLFEDSLPPLGTDEDFLRRIERNLDAVDLTREAIGVDRRHNWQIAVLSGLAGFIAGVISTLLYPYLILLVNGFIGSVLVSSIDPGFNVPIISETLTYALISGAALWSSISTYNLLSRTRPRWLRIRR